MKKIQDDITIFDVKDYLTSDIARSLEDIRYSIEQIKHTLQLLSSPQGIELKESNGIIANR